MNQVFTAGNFALVKRASNIALEVPIEIRTYDAWASFVSGQLYQLSYPSEGDEVRLPIPHGSPGT